jgi:hypothetical protein
VKVQVTDLDNMDGGAAANLPAPHVTHAELELAPGVAEALPTAHAAQVLMLLAPVESEYVPAGHAAHVPAPWLSCFESRTKIA